MMVCFLTAACSVSGKKSTYVDLEPSITPTIQSTSLASTPTFTIIPVISTLEIPLISVDNLSQLSVLSSWKIDHVYDLAFSPDSTWLVTVEDDGIHKYDAINKDHKVLFVSGYEATFSRDGTSIGIIKTIGSVDIYDPYDMSLKRRVTSTDACKVSYNLSLNHDGTVMATSWEVEGGRNTPSVSAVGLIDLQSLDCTVLYPRIGGQVMSLEFDSRSNYIVISTTYSTTFLWDIAQNRQACSFKGSRAKFKPSDPVLAVFEESVIVLWDPTDCKVINVFGGFPDDAFPWFVNELMDFSPDGRLLAAAMGSRLQVWDTLNVELVYENDQTPQTFAKVIFSLDGRYILTENHEWIDGSVSTEGHLTLWAVND